MADKERHCNQQLEPSPRLESRTPTAFALGSVSSEREKDTLNGSAHARMESGSCSEIESPESSFFSDPLLRNRRLPDWKAMEGRSKEWRRRAFIKLTASIPSKKITNYKSEHGQVFDTATAGPPVAMLRTQVRFKRAVVIDRRPLVSNLQRKSFRQQSKKTHEEPFSESMSTGLSSEVWLECLSYTESGEELQQRMLEKQGTAPVFENIRKKLEPLHLAPLPVSKKKWDVATSLIPYENYVGSILGGQFRLGHVIREDEDGEVYAISDLSAVIENIEAKAFTLNGVSQDDFETRKRSMNKLSRRKICSIDQAGRKFIVYRCPCPQPKSENMPQASGSASKAKGNQESMTGAKSFQGSTNDQGSKEGRHKRRHKKLHQQTRQQQPGECKSGIGELDDKVPQGSKHSRNIVQLSSELASAKTDASTPANQITKQRGRKRLRKRGNRKLSIPFFTNISHLHDFCVEQRATAIQTARLLFLIRSEKSAQNSRHPKAVKKYEKQAERRSRAVRVQLENLERRLERSISLLRTSFKLASELQKDLEKHTKERELYDDLLACDMYESLWMLRKNPPIALGSHPAAPTVSVLQQVHRVYSWEDLDNFKRSWQRNVNDCVNGRDSIRKSLYRRD